MGRTATPFLLLATALALAGGVSAPRADVLLYDYQGYGYEFPDANPAVFGEFGSSYVSVGFVPNLFAPLVFNTVANEYTYHLNTGALFSVSTIGTFLVLDYGPGTLDVYEDSRTLGTPGQYGTNPPNAVAPATFVDGSSFLTGALTNFRFIYDTASKSGSFEAVFTVTGGAQYGNIPANQLTGWTFSGTTGNEIGMPAGYEHQVDGQVFLNSPTPAAKGTWGGLKARYR